MFRLRFENIANYRLLRLMFEPLCTNFTQASFKSGLHMTLVLFNTILHALTPPLFLRISLDTIKPFL